MAFDLTALQVASTIGGAALATYVTRLYFDARDAWWKRAQWALDKAVSTSESERDMGIAAVNALAGNQLLLRRSDRKFLSASMQPLLDSDSESLDGPSA